jgi:hypothetical protein
MGKLKDLVRYGWSRWYVRAAAIVFLAGFALVAYKLSPFGGASAIHGDQFESVVAPTLSLQSQLPLNGGASTNYHFLCSLLEANWWLKVSQWVIWVALITGYIGFSFDVGYHWLRRRREQVKS